LSCWGSLPYVGHFSIGKGEVTAFRVMLTTSGGEVGTRLRLGCWFLQAHGHPAALARHTVFELNVISKNFRHGLFLKYVHFFPCLIDANPVQEFFKTDRN
jgi:hypothetical protein